MRRALLLALLLAGCGEGADPRGEEVTENQIRRLATPREEQVDPQAQARLQPIEAGDLSNAGFATPVCDFSRDGRLLFAVNQADALARIAGAPRHFAHASPIGPTGGFFEDRRVSVSVGRVGEVPAGAGAAGSWPARIIVTNRRAEARTELDGIWRCR